MEARGRPPKLTDKLKRYISQLLRQNKKLKGPRILELLKDKLTLDIKNEYPKITSEGLNEELGNRLPGLRSIQDYCQEISPGIDKSRAIDMQWHLGMMRTHPEFGITSQSLPYIFKIKELKEGGNITARQAFWISQFGLLHQKPVKKMKEVELEDIWKLSWVYAQYELVCELSHTEFDTSELDVSMWRGGPAYPLIKALTSDLVNNTTIMAEANKILEVTNENE